MRSRKKRGKNQNVFFFKNYSVACLLSVLLLFKVLTKTAQTSVMKNVIGLYAYILKQQRQQQQQKQQQKQQQ